MKKLVIDCGGTKIEIGKLENNILISEAFEFCGNINTNEESLIEKLKKIIDYSYDVIVVGIAGYRAYVNKEKLHNIFGNNVHFMSDIDLASLALLHNREGFICILGTGSVMANVNNEVNVIGGYGHVVGDIGSGYHFGKVLVTQYLRNIEVNQDSPINTLVENYFNVQGRKIIPQYLGKEKEVLSKLSAPFMDHPDMQEVFNLYFSEFIDNLNFYIKELKPKVVIISGSITNSKRFTEKISHFKGIEIRNCKNIEGIMYYE